MPPPTALNLKASLKIRPNTPGSLSMFTKRIIRAHIRYTAETMGIKYELSVPILFMPPIITSATITASPIPQNTGGINKDASRAVATELP